MTSPKRPRGQPAIAANQVCTRPIQLGALPKLHDHGVRRDVDCCLRSEVVVLDFNVDPINQSVAASFTDLSSKFGMMPGRGRERNGPVELRLGCRGAPGCWKPAAHLAAGIPAAAPWLLETRRRAGCWNPAASLAAGNPAVASGAVEIAAEFLVVDREATRFVRWQGLLCTPSIALATEHPSRKLPSCTEDSCRGRRMCRSR